MVFVWVSFLLVVVLAGVGIFLLVKDRQFWQAQYQELLKTSRQHHDLLFDRLLQSKGVKPLTAPKVKEVEVETRTQIDPEDFAEYEDRLQERVEYGLISEAHKREMMIEARMGHRTKEQIDMDLWRNPVEKYQGSEAEFY